MKKYFQIFILSAALIFISKSANAYWSLFAGAGFSYYQGDVQDSRIPSLQVVNFSWKAGVGYDFNQRWGLRAHYAQARLHGSDAYSNDALKVARGITFTTPYKDIGLTVKYNYLFKKSRKFINYGFFGFDYMQVAVSRTVTGTAASIQEGAASPTQFNIPAGIGVGRWFRPQWGFILEGAYHYALSDYLDGTALSGNPRAFDSFIDMHIMLIYRFGRGFGGGGDDGVYDPSKLNNVDCPQWGY